MNTLDTPAQMDTAHNDGGYITEFKEKVSLSNALIQLGDVLNLKLLNNLQKQQISLQILIKKFMNLHSSCNNLRERKSSAGKAGIVQGLLQEFSLSSQEGVALMCLAEALLRIPDTATRDF
jgi:RHH-type proline utilization regulon transcriptional repressor/proline dehydrogenase/delta 1-pyrroline-5-carboxylate dehydrogenase